jgi:acyl-CoA ligase (AMP-forming) (exosortase A-associated)
MAQLIHELVVDAAARTPAALALRDAGANHSYAALAASVEAAAAGFMALGVERHDRIAVYLPQCAQAVHALMGAAAAGGAFVPLAPPALPQQVAAILRDCGARILVTSADRLAALAPALARCRDLRTVLVCGAAAPAVPAAPALRVLGWDAFLRGARGQAGHRCIETDMAALLYTEGGSAHPKGVVLSHRNLVAGAQGVARHLGNTAQDRLLTALPLSLDYGLNQLTSAFAAGAAAVLSNHAEPGAIVGALEREEITGLAAVPSMWMGMAHEDWRRAGATLRYLTCSGGVLPRPVLDALRRALPRTRIYLMYGLTEAFRSTCLAPEQLDLRPDSIGRPVPNAEVLVLRPDGRRCVPGEPGELVQRGPLVALGYWNNPVATLERFRLLPPQPGLPLAETALWSGDTACSDEDGYLYILGRGEDVIRTSGHRVSPADVEEVVYGTGLVEEAAAVGVAHPVRGQVIAVLATARHGCRLDSALLFGACRAALPGYMLPAMVEVRRAPLPRSPDGQIDRALLAGELAPLFAEAAQ